MCENSYNSIIVVCMFSRYCGCCRQVLKSVCDPWWLTFTVCVCFCCSILCKILPEPSACACVKTVINSWREKSELYYILYIKQFCKYLNHRDDTESGLWKSSIEKQQKMAAMQNMLQKMIQCSVIHRRRVCIANFTSGQKTAQILWHFGQHFWAFLNKVVQYNNCIVLEKNQTYKHTNGVHISWAHTPAMAMDFCHRPCVCIPFKHIHIAPKYMHTYIYNNTDSKPRFLASFLQPLPFG